MYDKGTCSMHLQMMCRHTLHVQTMQCSSVSKSEEAVHHVKFIVSAHAFPCAALRQHSRAEK